MANSKRKYSYRGKKPAYTQGGWHLTMDRAIPFWADNTLPTFRDEVQVRAPGKGTQWLQVYCWCESKMVWVHVDDIASGKTNSCGKDSCSEKLLVVGTSGRMVKR